MHLASVVFRSPVLRLQKDCRLDWTGLQSCQIVRTDQDQSGPVFLVHSHITIYGSTSPIFSEFLEQYFIDVDIHGLKNRF